eukprot:352170-Chlamydomonas_euryale.AAC.1
MRAVPLGGTRNRKITTRLTNAFAVAEGSTHVGHGEALRADASVTHPHQARDGGGRPARHPRASTPVAGPRSFPDSTADTETQLPPHPPTHSRERRASLPPATAACCAHPVTRNASPSTEGAFHRLVGPRRIPAKQRRGESSSALLSDTGASRALHVGGATLAMRCAARPPCGTPSRAA